MHVVVTLKKEEEEEGERAGWGIGGCLGIGCAARLRSWVSCCLMGDSAGCEFHVFDSLPIKKVLLSTIL